MSMNNNRRKIRLVVTFQAIYQGPDDIPLDYAITTEEMELVIPGLETKFVVLPKVLEGITDRLISTHNDQITAYYAKQIEINRTNGQLSLWNAGNSFVEVPADGADGQDGKNIELTAEEAREVYEEFSP